MSTTPEKNEDGSKPAAGGSPRVLLIIAVILLVLYVVLEFVLFRKADDKDVTETTWSRYTYLLGGTEAVVFTAVGWLFGREVNRKQAEQAEKATEDAADAKAKGEGLKQAILAHPVIAEDGLEGVADTSFRALREQARQTQF